jgi:hypothetical protein
MPEIVPPCFKVKIFDYKLSIALLRCEMSEDPSRNFSVYNKRLAAGYRFLPAILTEFPNDDP